MHAQGRYADLDLRQLNIPVYELRDELVLRLYGAVDALRDLEAMRALGKKSMLGSYELIHDVAELRVWIARRKLLGLIAEEPALFEETYRALRWSQEPLLEGLANAMKKHHEKTA